MADELFGRVEGGVDIGVLVGCNKIKQIDAKS